MIDFNLLSMEMRNDEERKYRYIERLGIICEDREPTPEQKRQAMEESKYDTNKLS